MVIARVIATDVVVHFRSRALEWFFSAVLSAFAYRLLSPGDTFASSPSYAYMASWTSENAWGIAIGAIAAFRLVALAINGSAPAFRPYSPGVRVVTAWLSSIMWFALAFSFYRATPSGTGWGTYGIMCLVDSFLTLSIASDAGHAIRKRHGR